MEHPSGDLLHGVPAIADYLAYPTYRQAYHAVTQGHLPAFKVGGKWCARKSTLDKFFADKERATLAGEWVA